MTVLMSDTDNPLIAFPNPTNVTDICNRDFAKRICFTMQLYLKMGLRYYKIGLGPSISLRVDEVVIWFIDLISGSSHICKAKTCFIQKS